MGFAGRLIAISMELTGLAIAMAISPERIMAQVQQTARALSPVQVNLRAKQVTVRIDGSGVGSGVIIAQVDNIYTVLTNWHVVQNAGQYTIQTIDGRQHLVSQENVKQISELDLAVVKFTANQNYQVADMGNSDQLLEGQNIYFSGYPGELRQEDNRYYRFFTANLVGILPQYTESGYSLVYNGEAFPGMSGGPVFDDNALLIGIYGEANIHALTGAISNYAIPIDVYRQAIAANNNSTQQPAPDNSNASTENESNPPEVTIDTNNTNTVLSSTETATNPDNQPEDNQNLSPQQSEPGTEPQNESTETNTPEIEPVDTNNSTQNLEPETEAQNESNETNSSETETVATNNSSPNPEESVDTSLISAKTGIDYTVLRNLLLDQKWEEANIQTTYLINEIIKTAKKNNSQAFIELKPLTQFACNDMEQINQLWQEYTDGSFGFSPQQQIWTYVNEQKEFSALAWRNFATIVGWKQGDIANSGGYLLYEQLVFNPQEAPIGHLPWWFASNQAQQELIKQAFNRCNFKSIEQVENPNSEEEE